MRAAGLLVALLQVAGGAAPPGGSISGHVLDKASGQPLPRMAVAVVSANRTKVAETITDGEGRYQFINLPPGKYAIGADNDEHHATYLRQWFGSADPANILIVPAPSIEIAAGESRTGVDIALTRALAIGGHVFDQGGDPQRDAEVYLTDPDGRLVAVTPSRSDDLGAYRVYGLRPGSYRVCTGGAITGFNVPMLATCYPTIPLLTQDAHDIDIRIQSPAGSPTAAPEDAPLPTTAETGTMHGIVVDKQSGRPLAHATVHLGYRGSTPLPNAETVTDDDGVFTIVGLPPGQYGGLATANGHVPESLSDRSNARDFTVRRGEVLQVTAALQRAYGINLRLVDPFDAPVSTVGVEVRSADGWIVARTSFANSSDDTGHVRVSGLGPGRYIVCAEPREYSASGPPSKRQKRDRLLRTCYPSTAMEAEAQPVIVGNADIDDLELRLVRGRPLSISGTIVDATGAPAPRAAVGLTKYATNGSGSVGFQVRADGQFEISNVEPGAYSIEATLDRQSAFVQVFVDGDDVDQLVVAMRRTTNVSGRVAIDDPSTALPNAFGRAPLQVSARLAEDRLPNAGSSRHATANSDGTFVLEDMFGTRRIEVQNPPPGWFVKSMQYGAADALDHPIEIKRADDHLEIVLSNHGATITGTVADVIDKRAVRARVLLFRLPVSDKDVLRIAGNLLSATGNYTFSPIRDGDYSIVALPADTPIPGPAESDRLAALAALGERVTVTDLDQRTVELRVTTIR
jgi:protocatechuate 3,4-dioxygenase beta subunit